MFGGYRQTYPPRTPTRYQDPQILREGYTQPFLTPIQQAAVLCGTALVTSIVQRPIQNLANFSFVTAVPGDKSQAVFVSDKRAHFFRTLFSTRWFAGGTLAMSMLYYVSLVGCFVQLKALMTPLSFLNDSIAGCLCGAATGVVYTIGRHPYDVLRATADHPTAPKKFRGPLDVLFNFAKTKPAALAGMYRGAMLAMLTNACQFGLFFGWYNLIKEDMVGRGTWSLFFACHLGSCAASIVAYPLMNLRQLVHIARVQSKFPGTISARYVMRDLKKKHGVTKVFDGFFRQRPFLSAVPLAMMMTLYDLGARRYTEKLHPSRKVWHSTPQQPLFQLRIPEYATRQQAPTL